MKKHGLGIVKSKAGVGREKQQGAGRWKGNKRFRRKVTNWNGAEKGEEQSWGGGLVRDHSPEGVSNPRWKDEKGGEKEAQTRKDFVTEREGKASKKNKKEKENNKGAIDAGGSIFRKGVFGGGGGKRKRKDPVVEGRKPELVLMHFSTGSKGWQEKKSKEKKRTQFRIVGREEKLREKDGKKKGKIGGKHPHREGVSSRGGRGNLHKEGKL